MKILIAEDDQPTAARIAEVLGNEGHDTVIASTGTIALQDLMNGRFDIAILDRLLPELDGISLLRAIREAGVKTHVLMLTALGSITNRVEGLEAGADDYLTKPFAMVELIARVNAIQRRMLKDGEQTMLRAGGLVMNIIKRELHFEGRFVPLQPREFRLLEELIREKGQILTRSMLLQRVWGFNFEPQTNLVETHLSRLRSKLFLAGAAEVIKTVRGSGYRLQIED